ncbi:hypothetical protein COV11_01295 [Candidatus Woesearchaeota archaeon CG10_big_fil_rev_8_21_14_0_10_30_7]|nr:MAG: hypothetical protein COV11_01295 [Candidatus Woesearchaeota archaeon CG10_big_fil_rev_8_21_14_0_10_30_7]
MTTLIENELYEYLSHLESEVDKRILTNEEGSLQHLMHSQLRRVIITEREFLKYVNSNGTKPMLSISPNGLPSVNSLNPDLEKICELSEDEDSFRDVGQQFRKGISGKNKGEDGHFYVPVSEDEWNKELKNRSKEKVESQIGFAVSEVCDGRFELAVREDFYLQGYDQHSKEFPILIREGRMRYHVVWNRLVDDFEESFYVPNTALVLRGRPIKSSEKQFDDVVKLYAFGNSDFKGFSKPWFMRWRKCSIDYAGFLAAGTNARIRTTENILDAIGRTLKRQVTIKGIKKNDLEQTLAFTTIPFKNAPRTTPNDEDLYNVSEESYRRILSPKKHTKFDLIFTAGGDKLGEIEYVLPHNEKCFGCYGGSYYNFTKGGIKFVVFGKSILNEEQYHNLQSELRKVKKR